MFKTLLPATIPGGRCSCENPNEHMDSQHYLLVGSRSLGCAVLIHLPLVQSAAINSFSYFNLKKIILQIQKTSPQRL